MGVFVEVCAIEVAEAVLVFGEVGGNPVEDNANVGLVAAVDEGHEVVGGAEASGGGEVASDLVAPGARRRDVRRRA